MNALSAVVLLAALLLAGCFNQPTAPQTSSTSPTPLTPAPGSQFRPEPRPEYVNGCLLSVCNADENSTDYKLIHKGLGLHQINADRHREWGVGMDGDLIVWQVERAVNGTGNPDTFAYNITQDKLYAIGWQSYYWQTLFEVSNGHVIVEEGSNWMLPEEKIEQPRRASLVLWTEATQERRILNLGLGSYGGPTPHGFDYPWVAFSNSNNQNLNYSGLFAVNVETEEVVPLWVLGPNFDSNLRATGATVEDGVAYYEVHIKESDERFWLHEVNLTTREDRIVHEGTGYSAFGRSIRSSDRYVVWYAGHRHSFVLYGYDRLTGKGEALTDVFADRPRASFELGGDWIVVKLGPPQGSPGGHDLVAIHIPTMTRIVLVPDEETLFPEIAATDGRRYAASLWRNHMSRYDTLGQDLYWGELPQAPIAPGRS